MNNKIIHQSLSEKVLGMAFKIHNILGPGLLEHCYQEAFCIELKKNGVLFEREKVFSLFYIGEYIGGYRADLVVDNKIILELKSVKELNPCMEAQIINYLRLSKVPVGYLMIFIGRRVVWKRFVCQRE